MCLLPINTLPYLCSIIYNSLVYIFSLAHLIFYIFALLLKMSWSVPEKYKSICDGSEETDTGFKIVLDGVSTDKKKAMKPLSGLQQQKFCRDLLPPTMSSIYNSPSVTASQSVKLQAAMLSRNRWNQYQNLTIKFMGGTLADHTWVKKVVEGTYTPLIMNLTLEWLPENDSRLADIRISFTANGSWSYLGKECLGIAPDEATMNLAWLDRPEDARGGQVLAGGVILHEFGHCLGPWIHECVQGVQECV
jgi:hypothetical protein